MEQLFKDLGVLKSSRQQVYELGIFVVSLSLGGVVVGEARFSTFKTVHHAINVRPTEVFSFFFVMQPGRDDALNT